jgi:hypothetical protein
MILSGTVESPVIPECFYRGSPRSLSSPNDFIRLRRAIFMLSGYGGQVGDPYYEVIYTVIFYYFHLIDSRLKSASRIQWILELFDGNDGRESPVIPECFYRGSPRGLSSPNDFIGDPCYENSPILVCHYFHFIDSRLKSAGMTKMGSMFSTLRKPFFHTVAS